MKKLLILSALTFLSACQHQANFKSANVIKPHLDAEILSEPEQQKVEIELQRFVYFDFNSSQLSAESKLVLDSHIDAMKIIKQGKIVLQGHTDQVGDEEYNHGLAKQRATSVWVYLVESGISEEHLVAVSMGKGAEDREGADPTTDRHVEIMY